MVEANQSYHPQLSEQSRAQIVRTIIAMAMFEARKEIKRKIQSEGRVKLCKVPHREIERMAKLMVIERRDEFIAKAKAWGVVQDELRRLQAKEERKRQRRTGHTLSQSVTTSPQASEWVLSREPFSLRPEAALSLPVFGGRFKGTIQANRVTLTSSAVVEGEIHHRSLAIEENAWFAGVSRPQEAAASEVTDTRSPVQLVPTDGNQQINGSLREVPADTAAQEQAKGASPGLSN